MKLCIRGVQGAVVRNFNKIEFAYDDFKLGVDVNIQVRNENHYICVDNMFVEYNEGIILSNTINNKSIYALTENELIILVNDINDRLQFNGSDTCCMLKLPLNKGSWLRLDGGPLTDANFMIVDSRHIYYELPYIFLTTPFTVAPPPYSTKINVVYGGNFYYIVFNEYHLRFVPILDQIGKYILCFTDSRECKKAVIRKHDRQYIITDDDGNYATITNIDTQMKILGVTIKGVLGVTNDFNYAAHINFL